MAQPSEQDTRTARLQQLIKFQKLDPKNEHLLTDALQMAVELQRWDEALNLVAIYTGSEMQNTALDGLCGYVLMCSNRFDEAEPLLRQAIESGSKTDTEARHLHFNLAYAQMMNGKHQSALDSAGNLGETLAPHEAVLKARILSMNEQTEQAKSLLEELHQQGHETSESEGLFALLSYDNGEELEGVRGLAKAVLEKQATNMEALITLGSIDFEQHRFETALHTFEQTVDLYPTCGRALAGKGQVLFAEFQFVEAEETLKEAVRYMPNHIGTWHVLAWSQIMNRKLEEALDAFEKALELDRNFGETHAGLSTVYSLLGNEKQAKRHAALAEKLGPEAFGNVMANMLLLESNNKTEEAQALLNQALQTENTRIGKAPYKLVQKRIAELQARQVKLSKEHTKH